ncbi:uncharacterized protein LOC113869935 [Abrus precatorius]|uniref:Uncharacterized protein LOC113869935 n=1 Tax=Abrus precatorius TaxID=3816 RepID=A0A8B8M180_ABRPR|nr:uncharacterized protein LOC113869935 [Abrus precatorius]
MKPDERKRRFNEAIVSMLYPSPPQHEQESEPVEALMEGCGSDVNILGTIVDDYDNASSNSNEEDDCEAKKGSRAQRKRIRKKKLKEEAIRRGKLIGPLLPLTHQVAEDAPAVRSNASEEGVKSMKVKQRRMAKRMAKQKPNASTSDNTNQRL